MFRLSPGMDIALVSSDVDARRFQLWESPLCDSASQRLCVKNPASRHNQSSIKAITPAIVHNQGSSRQTTNYRARRLAPRISLPATDAGGWPACERSGCKTGTRRAVALRSGENQARKAFKPAWKSAGRGASSLMVFLVRGWRKDSSLAWSNTRGAA